MTEGAGESSLPGTGHGFRHRPPVPGFGVGPLPIVEQAEGQLGAGPLAIAELADLPPDRASSQTTIIKLLTLFSC
jgi:hypothetical protein